MTDESSRDDEYDALATQLEDAGSAERFTDAEGTEHICLTPAGEKVARQLAMTDEVGRDELMEAPLEEAET